MTQAPGFNGLPFDPFSLFQDGLAAPEEDIGQGEVLQALVIASVVAVLDDRVNLLPEIARQIVIFQQNSVFEGLISALNLALGLGMIRRAVDMVHLLTF